MASKAPKSIDDLIRARMRRQQFVNSVLVFVMAAAVIAAAAYFIVRNVDLRRPARTEAEPSLDVPAPAASARPPTPVAPAAPVSVVAPAAVSMSPAPAPASTPPPIPKPVRPTQTSPRETEPGPRVAPVPVRTPAPPRPAPVPGGTTPAPPPVLEQPSAAAAKRMLFSIKCFDDLAYEGSARGRNYFSGLCKDGHRKEVSCAGAGCKVEYARPPSHLQ